MTAQFPEFPIFHAELEGAPFYWEAGPIGVLLIHGFTATVAEVRLLGRILNQEGYTVSGPLLPGHFTHPEDLNKVSWLDWVNAVERAYQELASRCEHVFVGGESTGGLLALYLGAKHPEAAGVLAYAPALRLQLTRFDILKLNLFAPFRPWIPKQDMNPETPWQGYPVNPLKGVLQLLRLQKVIDQLLPEIHQPVLVIQGCNDQTVSASVPQIILDSVSSMIKEMHWMKNSGHVVILEGELDQVATATLSFMQRALNEMD